MRSPGDDLNRSRFSLGPYTELSAMHGSSFRFSSRLRVPHCGDRFILLPNEDFHCSVFRVYCIYSYKFITCVCPLVQEYQELFRIYVFLTEKYLFVHRHVDGFHLSRTYT